MLVVFAALKFNKANELDLHHNFVFVISFHAVNFVVYTDPGDCVYFYLLANEFFSTLSRLN